MLKKIWQPAAIVAALLLLQTPLSSFADNQTGSAPPAASSQQAAPAEPLKGRVIVVDPGHGGTEPGASRGGIVEKNLNLQIAKRLQADLEAKGATVIMTRDSDTFVSLDDRVEIANKAKPDLFISIHINSMPQKVSPLQGVEVWYRTPQSKRLAQVMMHALTNDLKATDRGISVDDLYVVHHTIAPSVLCEVGFITNPTERAKLTTAQYQTKIADALTDGAVTYFNPTRTPTP